MDRSGKTLRYEYGLLFFIHLQVEYVITGCHRQFNQNMSRGLCFISCVRKWKSCAIGLSCHSPAKYCLCAESLLCLSW